jgi:hypothetical protein
MFSRSSSHSPSARCVSAANAVHKLIDIISRNACFNLNNIKQILAFLFRPCVFIVCCLCVLDDSVIGPLDVEFSIKTIKG